MCTVRSFPLFWQCVRSVLILLHRPFAKTFGVIRGVVKLGEPLATSLFAASAAYLACVAGDTYSVSAEPCHSSEDTKIYGRPWAGGPRGAHKDLRESLGWRPEGRFCGARALKPQ